jgi:hypothetical protein
MGDTPDPFYTASVDTSNNNNMVLNGEDYDPKADGWFNPPN